MKLAYPTDSELQAGRARLARVIARYLVRDIVQMPWGSATPRRGGSVSFAVSLGSRDSYDRHKNGKREDYRPRR